MELKDSLNALKNFGKTQIELDFGGVKMAFRNLTAGDEYELNAELSDKGVRDLAYFYCCSSCSSDCYWFSNLSRHPGKRPSGYARTKNCNGHSSAV